MNTPAEPKKYEPPKIRCLDGCGAEVDADRVNDGGWEYLPIQNRYRCRACWRKLQEVNAPLAPGESHE